MHNDGKKQRWQWINGDVKEVPTSSSRWLVVASQRSLITHIRYAIRFPSGILPNRLKVHDSAFTHSMPAVPFPRILDRPSVPLSLCRSRQGKAKPRETKCDTPYLECQPPKFVRLGTLRIECMYASPVDHPRSSSRLPVCPSAHPSTLPTFHLQRKRRTRMASEERKVKRKETRQCRTKYVTVKQQGKKRYVRALLQGPGLDRRTDGRLRVVRVMGGLTDFGWMARAPPV